MNSPHSAYLSETDVAGHNLVDFILREDRRQIIHSNISKVPVTL